MRIFKTKAFARFSRKSSLDDQQLREAIENVERGIIDADLGGGVLKQRIARHGGGKSGGFRSIIVFRSGQNAFFVHGFAKNELDNVGADELVALKLLATQMLAYGDRGIAAALGNGTLVEVTNDG